MNKQDALDLINRYQAGKCTAQEQAAVETFYNQHQPKQPFDLTASALTAELSRLAAALPLQTNQAPAPVVQKLWPRMLAVAVAIAAITLGIWFYWYEIASSRKASRNDGIAMNDVGPGKNAATLTLANGKTIVLNNTKTGIAVNANEIKYNDGTALSGLQPSLPEGKRNSMMLTASTPRGGQYQFTLPDGTKVWLNAASTLKFPSSFAGLISRKVELVDGEAYFEVAKVTKRAPSGSASRRPERVPFIVTSNNQQVTVLGTHFNINNYADEPNVKTTLFEGGVAVSSHLDSASTILKPGQQALNNGSGIQVKTVNVDEAIAWQKGLFVFDNENIKSVMRKVSRWYDLDVVYAKGTEKRRIGGVISRYQNVSEVLDMINATKTVQCTLKGKTIYINLKTK